MPITALPKATVHLLGSAQVLTTPTSLVKELIDNALDAKATSIDIIISKNTLDKIEVRDNGHGISSEDYGSLGKRGHTSKLRTFEELKIIGGVTLGFRGEALASAVELGDVTLTTKTEGETVGTKLVLKAPGGVDRESRTSHPVGTTISVLKFMYKLPIRKKTIEKEATKTLTRIIQLLRSYALARPSIRFSLKVTDGGKGAWSFAPRPHDGVKEAISLIIGRDAAMECIEKSIVSSENQFKNVNPPSGDEDTDPSLDTNSHSEGGDFTIEAFLPKADANASKVGSGQYLSIDSRPVSHEKGTMKKVVALFKKYIRGALADTSEKLKNPFLRLNIKCPVASYDANVEPAKDDVLFSNEDAVLELAENLLKDVYGELKPVLIESAPKSLAKNLDDFELLLARNPTPTPEKSSPANAMHLSQKPPSSSSFALRASPPTIKTEMEEISDEQVCSDRRKWGFSMSNDFSEEVDDGRQQARYHGSSKPMPQHTPGCETPIPQLNPWTIAKLTAPVSHNHTTSESDRMLDRPLSEVISSFQLGILGGSNALTPPSTRARQTFRSDDIRALQPSVSRRYSASAVSPGFDDEQYIVDSEMPLHPISSNDFLSARNIPQDTLISPPSSSNQLPKTRPRARGPNTPLISPLATVGNRVAPVDRLVQTTLFGNNPRPRRRSDGGHVISQNESNQELAWAMDFEQRKEDTTRRRREEIRATQMVAGYSVSSNRFRSSPHKNRYNVAVASLEPDQARLGVNNASMQPKQSFKTTLPDGDPRAHLMKRQKPMAPKKGASGDQPVMMSAKSTRLPLERIPQEEYLHNLVYNMSTNMENLQKIMDQVAKDDLYVRRGIQCGGLTIISTDTPAVARKLQDVVKLWMRGHEERIYEVEYNFGDLLSPYSLSA